MARYRFYLFLICFSLSIAPIAQPMEQHVDDVVLRGMQHLNIDDSYDSDSEDEQGYTYQGLPHLAIPDNKRGTVCIPLSRGIHFSPSKFIRHQRSQLRKANDAGKEIFSSAAYDLAGQPLDSENKRAVQEKAIKIRDQIKQLPPPARNLFQEIYSNQYDGFHRRLGTDSDGGIFKQFESKKNPQVSTSEDFFHAEKYASGYKFLGTGVESLDPAYDASGKPRHPYLGKLFAILVSANQIDELAPYFVVHGHAHDDITVFDHFRKNVLSEREVALPGLIPGDCVVLSVALRVPSFKGGYKPWYEEKFGMSKSSYLRRQKLLAAGKKTIEPLLMDVILPHIARKMKEHIANECAAKNIQLVYKQLDGSLGQTVPSLVNATDYKNRMKQYKNN